MGRGGARRRHAVRAERGEERGDHRGGGRVPRARERKGPRALQAPRPAAARLVRRVHSRPERRSSLLPGCMRAI